MSIDALNERRAIVSWLRQDGAEKPSIRFRLVLAALVLFRPILNAKMVQNTIADAIERGDHLMKGQDHE